MIHLYDDYYLDNDKLQFVLKKKLIVKDEESKNYGKEKFSNIGHYPKLEQLIKEASIKKLREDKYEVLIEMLSAYDNIADGIRSSIINIEKQLMK